MLWRITGASSAVALGMREPEETSAMADEALSPTNVVVVSFETDANAYEAMTKLKELDSQDQVDLRAAAVIVRHEDGQLGAGSYPDLP